MDHGLGRGDIGGVGDIVDIAQAQQAGLIRLGGLGPDGIAEIQQQVDLIAGNPGSDLLIAAMGAAQELKISRPVASDTILPVVPVAQRL